MVNNFNKDSSLAKSVELLALSFAMVLIALNFSLQAETTSVCPAGCQYGSIQNAVDAARPGDTIKVKAGTYEENVKINKDLTLKGAGSSKAKIDGAKEGSPIVSVGPDQVKVTIEDLTLSDAEGGGYQEIDEEHRPVGISVKGKAKVEIRNSTVTDNVAGLAPLDSAEFVVYNSEITDNIYGFVGGPWASPKLTVKSSTITENMAGFFLSGSSEARVEDSAITDNHVFGVLLDDSSQATIKNSEVSETQWSGLVLRGSSRARVEESTIKANGEDGIALVGSSNLNLINSRIKDNQKGLVIYGPDGFKGSIEGSGNKISDNETNFKNVPGEDRKQLLATPGLPAPVNFPDEKLEKAIREAIDKPKGKIYLKDLEGLKRLRADAKGIKDLEGIEHCKDLEVLSLEENEISDLCPLSQLRNLSKLYLEKNDISDIDPLSNLTSLEKLDLADNRVASLKPISELDSLVGLWLYNNDISDITPLSGLTKLRKLWLIDNEVSDLSPLSGLKNLVELYLIDNEVSDIESLSGMTALKTLALSGNQISDLGPLLENSGLGPGDYIGLSANKLDTFMGSKDVEDAQTLRDRGATVEYGMQRHETIKVSNGEISVQAMDYGYVFDLRYPKGSSNSFMGKPVNGGNIFVLDFHLPGRSPYRPYMKDHQSIYSFGQWSKVNKRTMKAVYSYKKLRVEVTLRLPQEGSFFEKVYEIKNIGDEPLENGMLYAYTHPSPNGTSKGTSKYFPELNMIYSTSDAGREKYLGVLSPDLKVGHDLSLTSQYSPKESLNKARKGQLNEKVGPVSGNTQFIFAGNLGSLAPGEKVTRSVYFVCGDELTELKELAVKQLRSK